MTIYIDVIFLENLVLNFIILYATGLISKSNTKLWKITIRSNNRSDLCNNLLLHKIAKFFESSIKINLIDCNDICII